MTTAEKQVGVVSIGSHFTDRNVHLISNYWGLDTIFDNTLPDRTLQVSFVSTASRPAREMGIPARFYDAEKSWLHARQTEGVISYKEFCLAFSNSTDVEKALQNSDVIFMGGGNTPYLLQEIQDSGAGPVIRDFVEQGGWYFGKSAGAIVAGPDIYPRGFLAKGFNTRPLTDTTGLGLTDAYPFPHIDTASIMDQTFKGKTGWQHAVEVSTREPIAYILDNTNK